MAKLRQIAFDAMTSDETPIAGHVRYKFPNGDYIEVTPTGKGIRIRFMDSSGRRMAIVPDCANLVDIIARPWKDCRTDR